MSAAVENTTPAPAVAPAEVPAVADSAAVNNAAVAANSAVEVPAPAQETPQPAVVEITSKAQFDALRESTPYVALQAHAVWCGPCKLISPIFKSNAEKQADIKSSYAFARFDIDEIPELAEELGIRTIPAFFFFEAGATKPASEFAGAKPQPLVALINTFAEKAREASAPAPEEKPVDAAPAKEDAETTPAFSTNEDF